MRNVGTLLIACLAASSAASAATTSGPQDQLDRLMRPWRKLSTWMSGTAPEQQRQLHAGGSLRKRKLHDEAELHSGMSAEEAMEAEAEEESKIKWGFVVGILALGATFIGGYILETAHIHWMPEAGVGLIMGALVSASAIMMGNDVMSEHEKFDFEFFMTWLLPPIIFEAGYNMNVGAFINNIGPTMFYAFIGTFASTFVVGGICWQAGQWGWCYPLSMLASLTFGSLISATDPVTVLAVFQALGVRVDLFSMVFGESVLNDAVAIVLSRTLLGFNKPGTEVNQESIMAAAQSFCVIFGGSLIIGAFFGIASSLVFKAMDMRHHGDLVFMQAALSFAFPWSAYFMSEALELSGIVTILFCGMIMAVYTRYNFHEEARKLTAGGYKCVAVVAETYVFVYLGMAVFTFPIFESTTFRLVVVALGACFIGRLHIYVGSILFNCFRTSDSFPPTISSAYMFIMWFSGLRGGVAFALASVSFAAMDFPDTCGGLTEAQKVFEPKCQDGTMTDSLAILQTTLIIASFTIFVFGGAITDVARSFGVIADDEFNAAIKLKEEEAEKAAGNDTIHKSVFLPCLTFEVHDGTGLRQDAAVEPIDKGPIELTHPTTPGSYSKLDEADAGPITAGMSSKEIKMSKLGLAELSADDKIDEMRTAFPKASSSDLKKLLDEAGGDYHQAIVTGQSRGFM